MVVVLPAPSGPMRPNISPRRTSNDKPLTASTAPNRLITRSTVMATSFIGLSSLPARLQRHLGLDRHPLLEDAAAVVNRHLDAVHELRPLLAGLHVARRELGLRGHEGHLSLDPGPAGIGEDPRLLAQSDPGDQR